MYLYKVYGFIFSSSLNISFLEKYKGGFESENLISIVEIDSCPFNGKPYNDYINLEIAYIYRQDVASFKIENGNKISF